MKNVIVKIVLVAAIFIYGNVVSAQEKAAPELSVPPHSSRPVNTPEVRTEKKTAVFKTKLNLTPEQEVKVNPIVLNHEKNLDKAMEAAGNDIPARQAAVDKEREKFYQEMSKVLTSDQLAALKEMHKPVAMTE
jgi:hypothetical protein